MGKHRWRWPALITLLGLLGATSALAADGRQKVEVVFRNIVIIADGRRVEGPVEPFIVVEKGTAMVPLRTVAEALGRQVVWDGERNIIYIGDVPGGTSGKVPVENLRVLRRVGDFYHPEKGLDIAGRHFGGGLVVEVDEQDGRRVAETVVDLNGKFRRLEGYYGVEDGSMNSRGGYVLRVLADEWEIFTSAPVWPSAYPAPLSLDVAGVRRLTLRVEWQAGQIGEYSRVLAGLANWQAVP